MNRIGCTVSRIGFRRSRIAEQIGCTVSMLACKAEGGTGLVAGRIG